MNTDAQSNETRYQAAYSLLQRYLQFVIEKDLEGWMSLWDENAVLEFPFAPQGRIARIEGKTALYPYIQEIFKNGEFSGTLEQQVVHLTLDPDLIIVEVTGKVRIIASGCSYNARYVWLMRTKNGKLIHQRDYWNPLAPLEAKADLDAAEPGSKAFEQEQS